MNFISWDPHVLWLMWCNSLQTMIERLLLLLKDSDYRVRFSLARQIGVLFQTWDGHEELFQDIWWVILHYLVLVVILNTYWLFLSFALTCQTNQLGSTIWMTNEVINLLIIIFLELYLVIFFI